MNQCITLLKHLSPGACWGHKGCSILLGEFFFNIFFITDTPGISIMRSYTAPLGEQTPEKICSNMQATESYATEMMSLQVKTQRKWHHWGAWQFKSEGTHLWCHQKVYQGRKGYLVMWLPSRKTHKFNYILQGVQPCYTTQTLTSCPHAKHPHNHKYKHTTYQ